LTVASIKASPVFFFGDDARDLADLGRVRFRDLSLCSGE
jgi:hypothetical protein